MGTIYTFYSYKGGVGRTMTLANAGALLARWGYKVLCIDWDLEAPGLHLYFSRWWKEAGTHPGLVELAQAHADGRTPRWERHVATVPLPEAGDRLSLMTAGAQDASYVRRVQALDWPALYERHDFGNVLEKLRDAWKARYDFVLVDSRTGITDIGGICTVQLPDHLVVLFTANDQSFLGALDVARRASEQRNKLPYDRGALLTLPIATRFEMRVEYEMAQSWLRRFAKELEPIFSEWAHAEVKAEELLNFTKTPYVAYWSFGERLPVVDEGTKDPESLGYALETVTAILAQRFEGSEVLVRNRDAFVEAAWNPDAIGQLPPFRGPGSGKPARLFISYAHEDEELVGELRAHLALLERTGVVQEWSSRQVTMGEDIKKAITEALEQTRIILPILSADFFASDYLYEVEMVLALKQAQSAQSIILPIIARPVSWMQSPLGTFTPLPRGGHPITSWRNRDEAWIEVVRGIREAVERLRSASS